MDQQKENGKPNGSAWERHFQTIIMLGVIGFLGGGYNKIGNISDSIIVIKEQAVANREIINELTKGVNRLQMNDQDKSDRINLLEYQMRDLKERVDNSHPMK